MPKNITIQNKFTRGLITEAHGLDFPEDACTSASNCVFTLVGEVTRRLGIDLETNHQTSTVSWSGLAVSSFRWTNAGGDGQTDLLVLQVGSSLNFYQSSNSTVLSPVSSTRLSQLVNIAPFQANNNTDNVALKECQFAAGNGILFVFHPDCDPFYITFNNGLLSANLINVQIRDFLGVPEPGVSVSTRPFALSKEHDYNLQNQGWVNANTWFSTSTTTIIYSNAGDPAFNLVIATGIVGVSGNILITYTGPSTAGLGVVLNTGDTMTCVVNSYNSTTGVLNVTPLTASRGFGVSSNAQGSSWNVQPLNQGNISNFFTGVGVYPANCDVWFTFKNSTGSFSPSTTAANVTVTSSNAPQGHFILSAFNQNRNSVSGNSITSVSTVNRPSIGTWFQGRVWYSGVNASVPATGDMPFYTWTENIYFSQVIEPGDVNSFGNCYQENDPTSETLFDILPTDGGVIVIPGCGAIYKLFPIQNGILVFAQNGVWFITGNQGLGFIATSYTVTKISSVQSISPYSFVEVFGLPYFWNEEGIYKVAMAQGNAPYGFGGFTVEPITTGTILSFYNDIPKDSKLYARGAYNPITYVLQWTYRSTQEVGISNRYLMDSILNLNIAHSSFYPYTISSTVLTPYIASIFYLNYPNSITSPEPDFKYVALCPSNQISFADEHDTSYKDWTFFSAQDYSSSFTTGYSLQGKGVFKHQPTYVYVFSRNIDPYAYNIEGIWDYSINKNSGRQSTVQTVINGLGQPNFGMLYRRHKIRGHGMVLQLNFSSVTGQPFDIMGWTVMQSIDAGI